jgi:hypothetical protein
MKQLFLAFFALLAMASCDSISKPKASGTAYQDNVDTGKDRGNSQNAGDDGEENDTMANTYDADGRTVRNERQDVIDAYIYAYPLVLMDITKDVFTNTPSVTAIKAPINQFLNKKTFPDPKFQAVVSPNADTLYSIAWLDLTKEPLILTVPDTDQRYYLLPMLDEWTNVFASPGTRTTGDGKGAFAIVGPNWNGSLPNGLTVFRSPTNIVWILGRINTAGPSDYAAVNKIQDQLHLTPLSSWGRDYTPPTNVPVKPNVDNRTAPVDQVDRLNPTAFFTRFSQILKNAPPASADKPMLDRLASLGIIPGQDFDSSKLSAEQRQTFESAVEEARNQIKREWKNQKFAIKENNWNVLITNMGNYGTDYLQRAVVAYGGLGANLPQDAIYPMTFVDSQGQPLNGMNQYVIHFGKDQIPPVDGFWSITLYNDRQFFVENPINRYVIGSHNDLKFNSDGSLDIYIQNASPGRDKEANWLPAPQGNFNLIMRLYQPRKQVLDGLWQLPYVKKVS